MGRLCAPAMMAEGADSRRAPVQEPWCGRGDHPEHGLVIHHQRDVDGEFAVAFDELARAVEGVDDPQLAPVPAFRPRRLRGLLGENRNVGT